MKKTLLSLITITFFLCEASFTGGGMAFAFNNGNFTYTVTDNTNKTVSVKLRSGHTLPATTEIPNTVTYLLTEYKVTEIEENAFQNQTSVQKLIINANIASIGSGAFSGCTGIDSIAWKAINCSDFSSSTASPFYAIRTQIKKFSTGASVTHIPAYLCYGMTNLENVTVYISGGVNSIQSIGNYAFYNCSKATALYNLMNSTYATSLTSIGNYAFYNCDKLTGSLTLSSSLTSIGTNAFQSSGEITEICIPTSVTSIGSSAFDGCSKITSVKYAGTAAQWGSISFGSSSANPCYYAKGIKFSNSSSVTTYVSAGSSTYKTIKAYAFYNDTSITTLSISSSVTTIGDHAFDGCKRISSITIPNSVTAIGQYAFNSCSKASTLTFSSTSKVATIGGYAFKGCEKITSIAIPASVTSIGNEVFWNCYALKTATFDAASPLTSIGTWTFDQCSALTSVTLPPLLENIPRNTFNGCSALEILALPATVANIESSSFIKCSSLKTIIANRSIHPILSGAVTSLTNFTPANVRVAVFSNAAKLDYSGDTYWSAFDIDTKIEGECGASGDNITYALDLETGVLTLTGSGAMATYSTSDRAPWYQYRSIITSVEVGSGITGIGAYAFKDCANITTASLPASLTSIGSSAFDGCSASTFTSYLYAGTIAQWLGIAFANTSSNPMNYVKKFYVNGSKEINALVIPNGTTTIPAYAFYNCAGLTSVTLPTSITSIGSSAFTTCSNIASVNYLGTIDEWCSITFSSSTSNPAIFSHSLQIGGVEQTTIYLSDELEEIKNYAFYNNTTLTEISLKNSTSMAANSLYGCTADIIVRGEITGTCGTGVNWSLLDGVLTISKESGTGEMSDFSSAAAPWYPYRASISTIVVQEGITKIGKYAFQSITGTCSVYLPASLATINDYGFYSSSGISYIVSANTSAPAVTDHQTDYDKYNSDAFTSIPTATPIYVPAGSTTTYSTAYTSPNNTSAGWRRFSNIWAYNGTCGATGNEENVIWEYDPEDKLLTISGTGAMADFANSTSMPWNNFKTSITTVVIESGVTNIGQYSFHGCTNLASLTIPSSVTSFKTITYNNCDNLTTVNYLGTANQWASCTFASGTANPMYASKSLQLNGVTLTTCTLSVPVNDYAFYEDEALQTLVLADGCTSVGEQSFYYCKNLKDVTISSDVAEFKSGAFTGCSALDKANEGSVNYLGSANQWASITFASYNSTPVYCAKSLKLNGTTLTNCTISVPVKERVFYNEKDLVSVTLDEGATSIASDAFYGCSALETISCAASANLASIGSSAFSGCSALADITLPASLQEVGSSAFNSCSALDADASVNFLGTLNQWASITFASKSCNPASLVHKLKINGDVVTACALSVPVKANTFADNTSLTSLTLGACCTTIGASAFEGCSNLAGTIAFPSTLTEIASQAFRSCTSISGLDFSQASSLTTLGSSAFYGCTSVAGDLYFPASVSSVGGNVFQNITGVTAIYANPTTAPTGPNQYTFNQIDKSIPFYVPSATAASSYAAAAYWQDFTNVSYYGYCGAEGNEENVMWAYNPSTHSLTISGTGAMADYELYGAPWNDFRTDIQHIVIEEDVTVIGRYAFYHCDNLKTVALPASLTEIKTGVFWYCNDMESYTYAGTLANWLAVNVGGTDSNPMRYTGKCIVNVDEEINDLVIPNGTTSIGKNAFYGCAGLESVTIPASLTSIGNVAFSNCSNIEEVNYLGTISQWCAIDFYSNQSNPAWLSKQLSINGVEQINIYLPDELSEIKDYVFGYNTKAETISVNSSTTIHTHAFDNCTADILYRGDAGGETADGLLWSLVDGLLTISGTGAMSDYSETETPWYPFRSIVTGIVVAEGVTAIGRNAFTKQASATSVLIASSVTSIGDWAFSECTSLTQITCNAETPPTIMDGKDGPSSYSSRTFKDIPVDIVVMVPIGSTSAYQASRTDSHNTTSGWARFTNYHEPAVTDIDIIDSENNGVTLTTYNGQEMTVHLTRTIISDSYNTICLPFAMSEAQVESAFGAECDIEELTRASYADGNLKLFFTKRTAIEAGKPYLIQPQSDVANPTIAGVTIDNTARPSEFEGVTFTGIFSPTVLANSDNLLFVGSANTLYMSSGGQMKGMRGYFELTTPQAQAAAKRSARIILHEEAATGIDEVRSENASAARSEKIMRNGQLFILRDGKTYNAQGALIK